MTTRADYTDQEWSLLVKAPAMVGLGMLVVSRSGPVGKLREALAYRACVHGATARANVGQNQLISAILDEQPSRHRVLTAPLLSNGDPIPLLSAILGARLHMVAHCEKVAAVLADRTPYSEAQEFKRWLMWIARRVAQASGDGWFGTGQKRSDAEDQMLDSIATALRIVTIVDAVASVELKA